MQDTLEPEPDGDQVIENFVQLINALDIKLNKMAKSVGYDASFLSRIKAGQRKPADIKVFVSCICHYIVADYDSAEAKTTISELIGCETSVLAKKEHSC